MLHGPTLPIISSSGRDIECSVESDMESRSGSDLIRTAGRRRPTRLGWAVAVAVLALGVLAPGSALAVDFATVSGHQAFSEEANQASFWGSNCSTQQFRGETETFELTEAFDRVIVKSGSGQFAFTIFDNPSAGETVFADTDGSFSFTDADQAISHITFCELAAAPTPTPTPTPAPTPTPTPTPGGEVVAATPAPTPGGGVGAITETLPPTDAPAQRAGAEIGNLTALVPVLFGLITLLLVVSPRRRLG